MIEILCSGGIAKVPSKSSAAECFSEIISRAEVWNYSNKSHPEATETSKLILEKSLQELNIALLLRLEKSTPVSAICDPKQSSL